MSLVFCGEPLFKRTYLGHGGYRRASCGLPLTHRRLAKHKRGTHCLSRQRLVFRLLKPHWTNAVTFQSVLWGDIFAIVGKAFTL